MIFHHNCPKSSQSCANTLTVGWQACISNTVFVVPPQWLLVYHMFCCLKFEQFVKIQLPANIVRKQNVWNVAILTLYSSSLVLLCNLENWYLMAEGHHHQKPVLAAIRVLFLCELQRCDKCHNVFRLKLMQAMMWGCSNRKCIAVYSTHMDLKPYGVNTNGFCVCVCVLVQQGGCTMHFVPHWHGVRYSWFEACWKWSTCLGLCNCSYWTPKDAKM